MTGLVILLVGITVAAGILTFLATRAPSLEKKKGKTQP